MSMFVIDALEMHIWWWWWRCLATSSFQTFMDKVTAV